MDWDRLHYDLSQIPNQTIGTRLRLLRYERKISLKQAADAIGTSSHAVQSWETGRFEPGAFNLACLSDFYKVSIDYLVRGKKSEYKR